MGCRTVCNADILIMGGKIRQEHSFSTVVESIQKRWKSYCDVAFKSCFKLHIRSPKCSDQHMRFIKAGYLERA